MVEDISVYGAQQLLVFQKPRKQWCHGRDAGCVTRLSLPAKQEDEMNLQAEEGFAPVKVRRINNGGILAIRTK